MKKITGVLLAFAVGPAAFSQIVTSPSVKGGADVATEAWKWTEVTEWGISFYVPQLKQSTSSSAAVKLNGSTGPVAGKGTYYTPDYSATVTGSNSFTNSSTEADFKFDLSAGVSFKPTLVSEEGASATGAFLNDFTFTLPAEANVSVTVASGELTLSAFKNLSTGHVYFAGEGNESFSDNLPAGKYELYVLLADNAVQDNHLGANSNTGASSGTAVGAVKVVPKT